MLCYQKNLSTGSQLTPPLHVGGWNGRLSIANSLLLLVRCADAERIRTGSAANARRRSLQIESMLRTRSRHDRLHKLASDLMHSAFCTNSRTEGGQPKSFYVQRPFSLQRRVRGLNMTEAQRKTEMKRPAKARAANKLKENLTRRQRHEPNEAPPRCRARACLRPDHGTLLRHIMTH